MLLIRWLEESLKRRPSTIAIVKLFLNWSLLCLNLLDDLKDIVAANKGVSHCLDICNLALDPVENAREWILEQVRGPLEISHQLIVILLTTKNHAIEGLDSHFGSLWDVCEVSLFILAQRVDYLLLEAHLFSFAGHKGDNLCLDVLVVEEHSLKEFVKSGKLCICLDSTIACRILHDAIVVHAKRLFILGEYATWGLLWNVFEQFLNIRDLLIR